jgi:hypothetical protein
MDAKDLREQGVVLLVDSLLRGEVVEMASKAPVRRNEVDDSSDDSLDLVVVSVIVEALRSVLTKAPRVQS